MEHFCFHLAQRSDYFSDSQLVGRTPLEGREQTKEGAQRDHIQDKLLLKKLIN